MSFLDFLTDSLLAKVVVVISMIAANMFLLFNINRKRAAKSQSEYSLKYISDIWERKSKLGYLYFFSQRIAPIIAVLGLVILLVLFFSRSDKPPQRPGNGDVIRPSPSPTVPPISTP